MAEIKVDPVPENLVPIKQITSEQGKLNIRDFAKGALVAIYASVAVVLFDAINDWVNSDFLHFDYKTVIKVAVSGLAAYLFKQLTDKTKTVRVYEKA